LLLVGRCYVSGDKAEKPDVFIKLLEGEFVLLVFLKVIEAEAGEVGNDDVARKVSIFKAGEIVLGLLKAGLNPCRAICVRQAESLSREGQ
jgi:hypothetical protein